MGNWGSKCWKISLINAIEKHITGKVAPITEAPVPGTTLGIIRLEGILPGKAKLLNTPGLLHPHHIATRLTREEQKLVQINKELKPRTYRIKVSLYLHYICGVSLYFVFLFFDGSRILVVAVVQHVFAIFCFRQAKFLLEFMLRGLFIWLHISVSDP